MGHPVATISFLLVFRFQGWEQGFPILREPSRQLMRLNLGDTIGGVYERQILRNSQRRKDFDSRNPLEKWTKTKKCQTTVLKIGIGPSLSFHRKKTVKIFVVTRMKKGLQFSPFVWLDSIVFYLKSQIATAPTLKSDRHDGRAMTASGSVRPYGMSDSYWLHREHIRHQWPPNSAYGHPTFLYVCRNTWCNLSSYSVLCVSSPTLVYTFL